MGHMIFNGTREEATKKYPAKMVLEDGGNVHIFDSAADYDARPEE